VNPVCVNRSAIIAQRGVEWHPGGAGHGWLAPDQTLRAFDPVKPISGMHRNGRVEKVQDSTFSTYG
jgi:hypothetical protein